MNTAQLPARPIRKKHCHLLFYSFLLLVVPSVSTGAVGGGISFEAAERSLEIDFSFDAPADPTKKLVGYKLYKEGVQVCATTEPTLARMNCTFLTKDGSYNFSMTAQYDDNTESLPSPAYPFVISSSHSIDFSWTVTNSAESQGGFRIYDNGVLLYEITDSAARQYTHTSEFSTADHTFTIAAVDANGVEKLLPDALTSSEIFPPTAVVSSSTAAGKAPLTVNFDGSSSTAVNPPLVEYSWVFGDGSKATGATASHVYKTAGTYSAKLTVKDSKGLTDSITTPIVVAQPDTANQQPSAVISADTGQCGGPLQVAFNGSQSSDPDGSIVSYSWDFGDGSTGSGATVQHTYADAKTYTATLVVTDDRGASATAKKEITCGSQLPLEVGEVRIDQEWVKVLFEKPFVDPVVVAATTTVNEGEPVTVRVRNVGKLGFEIRLQEWDYQNQTHAAEVVNYLVLEKGVHTLTNGSKLEAGRFTGGPSFVQVALQQPYKVAPVVLTQVASNNEADAVTGRVRSVNGNSFEFRLQEMELTKNEHIPETIGYIAWEPGKGDVSGFMYETGVTPNSVTDKWFNLAFQTTFPERPAFMAGMQTFAGVQTATVRSRYVSTAAALIKIEEEQSKYRDPRHARETVGYLVIGAPAATQP